MLGYTVDSDIEMRILNFEHAAELMPLFDQNRAYLRKWSAWADHIQNYADLQRFITFSLNQHIQNNGYTAGIWYKQQAVGMIGHVQPVDWPNKIGRLMFWLAEDAQGKGIMTRCLDHFSRYSLGPLGLDKLEIRFPEAADHIMKLAKRVGYTHECTLRSGRWANERFHDMAVLGLLRQEINPGEPG